MTVEFDTQAIVFRVRQAASRAVVESTENVLAKAISKIQNPPKTGNLYRRRGVIHQASAPGEAPASDTGRLVQSGRTGFDLDQLLGRVNFSTAYAAALEFGNEKIEPRPYARNSLNEELQNFTNNLRTNIRGAL